MEHESDCTKFYKCVPNGNYQIDRYEFQCKNGTAWDQTKSTCAWKNDVNACFPGDKFVCKKAGLFPDENDCGQYYECVCTLVFPLRFELYHRQCAPGTSFDAFKGYCNHSDQVKGCGAPDVEPTCEDCFPPNPPPCKDCKQ